MLLAGVNDEAVCLYMSAFYRFNAAIDYISGWSHCIRWLKTQLTVKGFVS
jgi:hypothetical protein